MDEAKNAISKIEEQLKIPEGASNHEVNINPLRIAIDYEFSRNLSSDYRPRAVDRCLKAGVSFHSECNTVSHMARKLIEGTQCLKPGCTGKHTYTGGGGNMTMHDVSFKCDTCGKKLTIELSSEGIIVGEDK